MRSEDIAKLAGVSRSTVSRVINNYSNVPDKTRKKVMKIIEEHHYEPNTSARALAGKKTNTIGLFVVSITEKHNPNRIYQNNYFAPFVDALLDSANAMGYYVLIHTVYSEDDFQKVRQAFQQGRIDGGIIVGTENNMEMARIIADLQVPFILIDYDMRELLENRLDRNNLAVINSKDYEGAAKAVEHLIGLGHQRIAFISGRQNTYSGRQRYEAYISSMESNGLEVNKDYILQGEFLKMNAYEEVKRMLMMADGVRPTAIFSANDEMALGAIEACKELGVSIPNELSLIGFDDIQVAAQLNPSLSSVRLPIFEMAKAAAHSIIDMCEKGSESFSMLSFPTQLMVRESCQRLVKD
ncbi:LacI family transcriptional regulator [Paenibacillus sp. DS2015]|uniref:LacI family DNA-binding transcriptional regulator n=1 Tax=Paenibacillus sp. DS2015 TaxID=3373917 RepID=UPI003D1AC994